MLIKFFRIVAVSIVFINVCASLSLDFLFNLINIQWNDKKAAFAKIIQSNFIASRFDFF